jgi:hypothetical protein
VKTYKLTDDQILDAFTALETQSFGKVSKAYGVKYETLRAGINRLGLTAESRSDGWAVTLSNQFLSQPLGVQI